MKIGIEIHQRLDTKKLFCDCTSDISEDEIPKITVQRRLHPVLSELGEIDAASQVESSKDRVFEYQVFNSNNCLVETDEEPPHMLNDEALKIVLQIALQFHATIVDEVHIMRKMVIDGSNTSGFQRTSIIAMNGHLDSSKGTIGIPLIALEEESAGIVSNSESKATYRLDRLGVPLIEINTTPDIKDGAHLTEVAEKIGMILRTTAKVARGLGTIRQDVNISTEGGARVEIKGAQDLKMLATYVENEVHRQTELIKILAELRNRKAIPIQFNAQDVTVVFKNTHANLLSQGIRTGSIILAQKFPGHKGILGTEIQKGKRYGSELSEYAKRAGVKGIIHSDEDMAKYYISGEEEDRIRKFLEMEKDDAFVLIIAPQTQAERAMHHAIERANMNYVPEETRRANPDGSSTYMRPLPGRARLYPETDVPPIPITKDLLSSIEKSESLDEKKSRLEKLLNKEMAGRMIKSRNLHLFDKLVSEGADPMLVATTLEDTIVSLRREEFEFTDLEKTLTEMFAEYKKDSFVKAAIPDVLKGMAKGARVEAVLKVFRLQKITGPALEKLVAEHNYDMKTIMQKCRLQVDAAEVDRIIKKRDSSYA
ncbi:Glutamyl-tRNA(Gln) amidotransferase subunit E [Candidatus Bilamarchaeum dharawalense]|uniref:Glutamyl-tRNA(Gln) amidotransferase subunit E n=1 Tax=Candidatus Bilamarchaeum dharawalense TaxID=2885759 RepID=A0A5E4LT97_9ARCH|nr:Glutamyl-tRNA(Gln) amidotransferase subunit E [Candidatus Bilamarchaeum dharawalense]